MIIESNLGFRKIQFERPCFETKSTDLSSELPGIFEHALNRRLGLIAFQHLEGFLIAVALLRMNHRRVELGPQDLPIVRNQKLHALR